MVQAGGSINARVGVEADLDKFTPLLQANCQRMQYEWEKYKAAAEMILKTPEYGFFIVCETAEGEPAGLAYFTFEWSDWRDGAFFWMQGMQVDTSKGSSADILAALKSGLDTHKAALEYRCCGIRLCSPKALHGEVEDAISTFELQPSHYYIYHVDTPSQ